MEKKMSIMLNDGDNGGYSANMSIIYKNVNSLREFIGSFVGMIMETGSQQQQQLLVRRSGQLVIMDEYYNTLTCLEELERLNCIIIVAYQNFPHHHHQQHAPDLAHFEDYYQYPQQQSYLVDKRMEQQTTLLKIDLREQLRMIKIPQSKMPVFNSLLYCAFFEFGIMFSEMNHDGLLCFKITDYVEFFSTADQVNPKRKQTINLKNRINSYRMWFSKIPAINILQRATRNDPTSYITLTVNRIRNERVAELMNEMKIIIDLRIKQLNNE